jgi:hypothetical protein
MQAVPGRGPVTLEINGREVEVGPEFLQLSPDEQNRAVDEIARSLPAARQGNGQAPAPMAEQPTGQPPGVPAYDPGVPGYNPQTGMVERDAMGALGTFGTSTLEGIPILGGMLDRASLAGSAALGSAISGEPYSRVEREMREMRDKGRAENPGSHLAGNVAGAMVTMRPILASPMGSAAFGITGRSLGARTAASAISGGALSGADTLARGGSIGDAGRSAGIGAGIGAAIPGAGVLMGATGRAVADKVGGTFRSLVNPQGEAARRVTQALRIDQAVPGATLSQADVAAAQRAGQPIMAADLGGETTRALARAAANQSPAARSVMERAVSDRFATQGDRITRLVSRLSGGKTDDLLLQAGLRDAAAASNGKAYTAAFARPEAQAMWGRDFAQLMEAPAIQDAARRATSRGANRAAVQGFRAVKSPFVETQNGMALRTRPDGSVAQPTLQFWDQVKRNLDDQIGEAARAGQRSYASDLMALKGRLVGMLDDAVPQYRSARQGAAAWFGAEDAIDAGRQFAKSNRMLPEYQRGILAMKPAEREAFETGFSSELIDQAKNASDRANVVQRMFGSEEARQKIKMAFGAERAREVEAFVRVEVAMDQLRNAFGNSTTARQLIESGVIGGGAWMYTGDWRSGVAAAAVVHGARIAGRRVDGNVMTKTAEMLMSGDPQSIANVVRTASKSPMHMGALDALTKATTMTGRAAIPTMTGGQPSPAYGAR